MSVTVKVCGITRGEDIETALSLGVDYLGINLYPKSPRCVPHKEIADLISAIPPGKRVMVDVATSTDELENFRSFGFDAYQIHFDLSLAMASIAAWSGLVGKENLWLAPRIPPEETHFPQIIMEFADTMLLDAYSKNLYGGTGEAGQNWQRFLDCTAMYQHKRWVLAGGLGPDTIETALAATEAQFVDLNSGVESSPGVKDPDKLAETIQKIRRYAGTS